MRREVIEQYLARYVNRIAVTNNRLELVKETQEVNLLYNDCKNQKQGQMAPKRIKAMHPPLVFIHQKK
jgi:Putative transposase.